ncbi:hypothetical protein HMPREF1980_02199, partial [Actinomyces sp. oral taxon 172 str. F0311]
AAPARGGGPVRVKNEGNAEEWLDGEAAKIPAVYISKAKQAGPLHPR